jgi:DNA (cytosine-5)-methyltransferase 1
VWETQDLMLFCEHPGLFAEVWPTSGTTLGGRLFPLPASVLRTIADVFSSSRNLLPPPTAVDGYGPGQAPNRQGGRNLNTTLLPTPTARDYKDSGSAESNARMVDDPGNQTTIGRLVLAGRLLPSPINADSKQTTLPRRERDGRVQTDTVYRVLGEWMREDVVVEQSDYTPALDRWAAVLGRPHPDPTVPHPDHGRPQLNPRFVEWMMGLPDGWVTDVPGVSRTAQLKMLGNGVVPQQATAILKLLDDGW